MNRRANRERLYQLRMQVGVALTLALLIVLTKADIQGRTGDVQMQAARTQMAMMLIPPTVLEKKSYRRHPAFPLPFRMMLCSTSHFRLMPFRWIWR